MSRETLVRDLRAVVGSRYVLIEKEDVIVYEQDGSIFQVMPENRRFQKWRRRP
jgi:hypothetical protein